jgi:hypothetical protein
MKGSVDDPLHPAVLAFRDGDLDRAASIAQRATKDSPSRRLAAAAARYLGARQERRVYDDGDAFGAFIRGGSNVALYASVVNALRAERRGGNLLDVGAGDGMALLPCLGDDVERLEIVEPSTAMLGKLTKALDERGVSYRASAATFEDFARASSGRWDTVQATFSLQSIAPDARRPLLGWLRGRAGRGLIVEFDVPAFGDERERFAHVAERYERGIAEYDGSDLVVQGFLMPMFFSAFGRDAKLNHEQPRAAWEDDLRAAGFADVHSRALHPYWWADAFLVHAA